MVGDSEEDEHDNVAVAGGSEVANVEDDPWTPTLG